jgi:hypothetical protein
METLQRTANRGSISTGYDIDNSVKLEADNTEYMDRVITSQGNQKTFTISAWVKRTEVNSSADGFGHTFFFGGAYGNEAVILRFNTGTTSNVDALQIGIGIGTTQNRSYTQRKFRDTSAWYHIVLAVDTTQSTATDRFKLYVNGVLETEYASRNNPAQNLDTGNNKAQSATYANNVGAYKSAGTVYGKFCGYIAEVYNIDGSALAPTAFGEFDEDTGIWKPIEYTGSFPNNSFYLDFKDSSDLGAQAKGDDRNFTTYNITSADQATDTPTNNFCTINPLIPYYGSVSEGATKFLHTAGGDGWESFVATMGAGASGKWYAEFKFVDSDNDNFIGICPIDDPDLNRGADHFSFYGGDTSLDESVGYYATNGQRYIGGGGSAYGNTYARTNIMSIAVDMDNGKLYFAKDGVWQNSGDPTSGATGTGALDVRGATKPQSLGASNYYSGEDILANYGGFTTISISSPQSDANGYGTFEYAPPSGYYALCTKNLAVYG